MLTFHANQDPDIKMIEVKKRVKPCLAAQVNEPFSVGAKNGVMQGKAGDYLLSDENGLSVVKEADFPLLYEGVKIYIIPADKIGSSASAKDLLTDLKAMGIRVETTKIEKKPKVAKKCLQQHGLYVFEKKPKEAKVIAKKSATEIYQKKVVKKAVKKVVKKVAPKKVAKKKTSKKK